MWTRQVEPPFKLGGNPRAAGIAPRAQPLGQQQRSLSSQVNELVQVETYLRSEGVLVRYWYPIDMLERPPAGHRRTATNGLVSLDNSNIQIHR